MKLPAAFLALCVLAAPALAAGGAGAEQAGGPKSSLALGMTLYAGGIPLGKVDMNAKFEGDKYSVVSNLETSGVVNAFWQSQIQATSNGIIEDHVLKPSLYDSFYTGHSANHQEVSLSYDDGDPVRLYANPPYSTTDYEVKADQKKATFDPLSTVVFIASGVGAQPGNPCSVHAPVYDGRRRYDVTLTKVKEININMDDGLYKGPGLLCSIKYKQISGYKPRVLRTTNFPSINAWVATFSGVNGRKFAIPLRVWADSEYGTISAVATALKIDGNEPKSEGG